VKEYTKRPKNVPNGNKIYQMIVKYSKCPLNVPTFSIPRPSKIGLFGVKMYHLATLKQMHSIGEMGNVRTYVKGLTGA
jgi:hypothetical protein